MPPQTLTIIVPVFNEANLIQERLAYFLALIHEVQLIFVDGGSTDGTAEQLRSSGFIVLDSPSSRNRGAQLATGIRHAHTGVICMHHFDTIMPEHSLSLLRQAVCRHQWGRFDISINHSRWYFRIIETGINWRSYLTAIATGDQCIFVQREYLLPLLDELDRHPLMEDIYLSRELRRSSRPARLRLRVKTSPRYWQKNGVIKSIFKMWYLRARYFFGTPADMLYRQYYQ